MPEHLVLLHGFAGTRRTWDGVSARLDRKRYTPLALDLPGHGASGAGDVASATIAADEVEPIAAIDAEPIDFDSCVERVLARSPESFVLCGYSLGGRVALHVALAAPARVRALVLVSCTAGIADAAERAARRAADEALAVDLERRPFEEFMDRWAAQPVFAHDPPQVHAQMRAQQRENDPLALAAVLRGVGTGQMRPLWDRLGELRMPARVLVGERDEKFHAPGRRLAQSLGDAELSIVPGGHRLPLENPGAVVAALVGGRGGSSIHANF